MPYPLSRIVRTRLSELGLGVEDLIDRSALARSTVYSFLNDTRNPHGDTLRKLAAGLNWSAAELQARVDGTPLTSPVPDEQIARIVQLLPDIPKDRLDAIEQHITLAVQPVRQPAKRQRAGLDKEHAHDQLRGHGLPGANSASGQDDDQQSDNRELPRLPLVVHALWKFLNPTLQPRAA